jgi:hypothetical protein
MSSKLSQSGSGCRSVQCLVIALAVVCLSPGQFVAQAQPSPSPAAPPTQPPAVAPTQSEAVTPPVEAAPKIPNDQLDSLVAPIALYPDPLLAQTLAACTYPLEIVLLQQWLEKNKNLKDKALEDAVQKQPWDPSIQAMAALPEVVKQLETNISWASDLGNAFLTQQSDVMDAVQRMRAKANSAGNLKTTKEQKVESKQVQGKTVVVIEQADPQVVYVPSYNPTVVYGAAVYPYPSMYYPPYAAGRVLAFSAGVALGAAWRNNGWGYNCGWGNNNVNINVNNNFVNHYNKTNVNRTNINRSGNTWQHDARHRGGVPYSNKTTAQKFGGTTRSDIAANRPSNLQRPSQLPNTDRQRPAASDRQRPAASDRGLNNAPSQRPQNRMSGNTDRISSREVSRSPSPRTNNAFSGPSSGMNRSSALASHDRGSRSMSRSGGGFQRSSGGMRGGGRRR